MANAVKIARKALYQRVWAEPVIKLAREYGLSDTGFAKLCRRNQIPRPPRGFWARKAVGQNPGTVPLPRSAEDWEIEITPSGHDIVDPSLRAESEKKLADLGSEKPIAVPENLHSIHPLVSRSLHALEVAQKNECGIVQPPAAGCLDVAVSKDSIRRALLIMDALIKTFEARGYQVKLFREDEKAVEQTVVELMDTRVPFGIRESLVEKKEEFDDNGSRDGRYVFHHSRFKEKTVPSGELRLEIEPRREWYCRFGDGMRRKWADGKCGRLEDYLKGFLVGVIKKATAIRDAKLATEKRERERIKAAKQEAKRQSARADEQARIAAVRAAKLAKIETERAKVNKLEEDAAAWEESRRLRTYIEAVRNKAVADGKDVCEGSETGKWLRWAGEQADRLDPMKESPKSILDDENAI